MKARRVGVVGVDALTAAVAARLLDAGMEVVVHDPRHDLDELRELGAAPARLPADAADGCEVVVLGARDPGFAEELLFDHGGVTETLPTGGCVLDLVRRPRHQSRVTTARLAQYGLGSVAVVAIGSDGQARAGDLLLLVGGADDDVTTSRPVLDAAGEVWHLGPPGSPSEVADLLEDARNLQESPPRPGTGQIWVSRTAVRAAAWGCGLEVTRPRRRVAAVCWSLPVRPQAGPAGRLVGSPG
jgi:hypothetical protein